MTHVNTGKLLLPPLPPIEKSVRQMRIPQNKVLSDLDSIANDYVLLDEAVNLMQATENSTNVRNHILLCGLHPSIYYFILPLRAKYLKEY